LRRSEASPWARRLSHRPIRSYAILKKAFDENGIKFPVQIAGEGGTSADTAAVAQRTLELTHSAAA
jgi:hypothetical protein